MSGFAASWLSLREPHDRRARNGAVLDAVAAAFAHRADIRVVDLACGTGSTLRAISGRLPARQDWLLVDHDDALLQAAAALPRGRGVQVTPRRIDLTEDLEAALGGARCDLVAASALLDLVSAAWIEHLVACATLRQLPVYVALSYDGRAAIAPDAPGDAAVFAAVDRHQQGDKGFGRALGPAAAAFAVTRFAAAGYTVTQGTADWDLTPEDVAMQHAVVAGWGAAARASGAAVDIDAWLQERHAGIAAGRSRIHVGHQDFFARPSGMR